MIEVFLECFKASDIVDNYFAICVAEHFPLRAIKPDILFKNTVSEFAQQEGLEVMVISVAVIPVKGNHSASRVSHKREREVIFKLFRGEVVIADIVPGFEVCKPGWPQLRMDVLS